MARIGLNTVNHLKDLKAHEKLSKEILQTTIYMFKACKLWMYVPTHIGVVPNDTNYVVDNEVAGGRWLLVNLSKSQFITRDKFIVY